MQETQLNGESLDIVSENVSKLKELFPEIVTEDKIDYDKLKEVLGKYTEDDNERYNFTWKGKSAALRLAQTPSTGTLRPCKEESKNWDTTENLYIEGDNLEVLKLLQKSYYGKIKMIYIDPPYNTGKEFVYPDNFKDNLKNYLEITGQVDSEGTKISTNSDNSGRYHTNWLNMMYPRLRLARNLLKENGVIFISIDDNELENLKKICNEIFGEENFLGSFIRKTKSVTHAEKTGVNNQHEYCICYAKHKQDFLLKGELKNTDNYQNPDHDPNGPWVSGDPTAPRTNDRYEIVNPYNGKVDVPPVGRSWFFSENTINNYIATGQIVFKKEIKNNERGFIFKRYLKDIKNVYNLVDSLLFAQNTYFNQVGTKELNNIFSEKIFDNPKPTIFIEKLIKYSTSDKSIILDFFSGSGTTAHAMLKINSEDQGNRKFIMVQLQEKIKKTSEIYKSGYKNISEIGKERIRRAGDEILSEMNLDDQTSLDSSKSNNLDIGFKVFKLDSSNLSKWDPEYDNLEQTLLDSVENMVPGRKELDLVYEIMLKYGIDLTLPIEEYQIQDKKLYSIGFGALIICLDDNLTSDLASEIIKLKDELSPEVMRVVFKDNGFASDSDKTNIKETLKTNGIEEFVTI